MRTNEESVIDQFRAEGWDAIRGGWPDYLLVRSSQDGKLEFLGVEVKCKSGSLSDAQRRMHAVLAGAGIKVVVARDWPAQKLSFLPKK